MAKAIKRFLMLGAIALMMQIIAVHDFSALAESAPALSALEVSCGKKPKGKVLYRGRHHTEVVASGGEAGANLLLGSDGSSLGERRFAVLKGGECWIEFFAPTITGNDIRATGKFSEAFSDYRASRNRIDHLTAMISIAEFVYKISPGSGKCLKSYTDGIDAMKEVDATSPEAAKLDPVALHRAYSKCLDEELAELDKRGFVGVRIVSPDLPLAGFAWLDGKLFTYN
jgi:hypothetical protein